MTLPKRLQCFISASMVAASLWVGGCVSGDPLRHDGSSPSKEPASRPLYIGDLGFNREILFQSPRDSVAAKDLDQWPVVSVKSGVRFPPELAHTGFVGHISGVVVFKSDGGVALVAVDGGNSQLLSDAADEFIKGLSFIPPKKGGRTVAAVLGFECFITEQGTYGPIFEGEGRMPNQPAQPTAMSVTPPTKRESRRP